MTQNLQYYCVQALILKRNSYIQKNKAYTELTSVPVWQGRAETDGFQKTSRGI